MENFAPANNLTVSQGCHRQRPADHRSQQQADRGTRTDRRGARESSTRCSRWRSPAASPDPTNAAISSEMITELRTRYAGIAKSGADLTARYGNQHPQVANVTPSSSDTQRLIDEEIATPRAERAARLRRRPLARDNRCRRASEELQGVSNVSNQALVQSARISPRRRRPTAHSMNPILPRYKETSARESLRDAELRVVTRASIPIAPSSPSRA